MTGSSSADEPTLTRRQFGLSVAVTAALAAIRPTEAGAAGAAASPVGLWRDTDKETGRPKADIRITDQAGQLVAVVEKPYPRPGDPPGRVCDKCPGASKGHPFQGLQIMQGMHADGERWSGGTILDPESGDVYKCTMKPVADGRQLEVRGFLGISLFGRTETWTRLE